MTLDEGFKDLGLQLSLGFLIGGVMGLMIALLIYNR